MSLLGSKMVRRHTTYTQHNPYVTYEVHLHPTYRVPTLWFTLHDLPMGEASFDIEVVYRYLVPTDLKDQMRAVGVIGGISAAVGDLILLVRCLN